MKHILLALMAAAFVASMAPAVWAQGGEPNPPRSDVKSFTKKNTSQPQALGPGQYTARDKLAPKSNPATKNAPKFPQ